MFPALARSIASHPVRYVVAWAIATAAMFTLASVGLGDGNLFERSESGVPFVEGSDSYYVFEQSQAALDPDQGPRLTGEFSHVDATAPDVVEAVSALATELAAGDDVTLVQSPYVAVPGPAFSGPPDQSPSYAPGAEAQVNPLVSVEGDALLVIVEYVAFDDEDAVAVHDVAGAQMEAVADALQREHADLEFRLFSNPLLFDDFEHQIEQDLVVGELIALPLALIVMVLVFGGFLAASAPIIGAIASIAGGLAILFGFSYPIQLDTSAINVVTVLGIGLSIDYGLLVVSRFREELFKRTDDPGDIRVPALESALQTAGRTVFFSAVTVGIAVGGMLLFRAEIMRAFGGAAVGVVMMALLTALTLVPAVAFLYGRRLERARFLSRIPGVRTLLAHTADVSHDHGAFSTLAGWVQRRPWLVVAATTALLLTLASPLLGMQVRNSESELLPVDNERREFLDTFPDRYPALTAPSIDVLADASPSELDALMADVAQIDGVAAVTPASDQNGEALAGAYIDDPDTGGPEAARIVREIRALESEFDVWVGGQAAFQVDFVGAISDGAPLAAGLVVVATFVLLFLMTGSLLVPAKTLVINTLSLAATIGVVAWIFSDGHLESTLDFTSVGGVETYVVVLIAAFGFGLAMDYEVFLLARIKELVDAGVPNDEAVRIGLQRSGRIITSAAAIIILVFLGFAFGELLVIKEVGVGLAIAVLLDASIVRMLLVPATMTLLGEWNWWAPRPLRRFYERHRIEH